jgi:hypothetical protein
MSLSAARAAFRWAVLLGVLGGGVGAVLLTKAIGRSTSSTAALSFIELPIVMFLWGAPCAAMAFCAAYLLAARRVGRQLPTFRMLLAGLVLLVLAATSITYIITNLATGWEVGRVAAMDEGQLERVLASKYVGANPFVLAAVAQNPRASAGILRLIASRKDPQLHEKLSSLFDTMGSNTHGLAVMRLVARHPNVDGETLEILAQSDNDYVLSDVAMNPKLPEQTLRRLEQRSGQMMEWAIARNPKTLASILTHLSQSSDEYVRSNVAGNPSASPDDLARLAHDPVFHVRRNVASNPRTPPEVRAALRDDPDPRVRAEFLRR